jgi:hypothetical protein
VDYAVLSLPVAPRGVNAGGKLGKGNRMSPVWSNSQSIEAANIEIQIPRLQSDYTPRGATGKDRTA